jgi:hypothetical protein
MKQTAVEWLEKEFVKLEVTIGVHGVMYEIIEQAKEMEKQQIIKFTEDFVENFVYGTYDGESYQTKEISEYYNETYGISDWDVTLNDGLEDL